ASRCTACRRNWAAVRCRLPSWRATAWPSATPRTSSPRSRTRREAPDLLNGRCASTGFRAPPLSASCGATGAAATRWTPRAPGVFRSPGVAAVLAELEWISLPGRPDGDRLRLVAEGESNSDRTASDLRDFLEGIRLLAENGLNDPKLRDEMNPEERLA